MKKLLTGILIVITSLLLAQDEPKKDKSDSNNTNVQQYIQKTDSVKVAIDRTNERLDSLLKKQ